MSIHTHSSHIMTTIGSRVSARPAGRGTGHILLLLVLTTTHLWGQCICRDMDDYGSDPAPSPSQDGHTSGHKFVSGVYSERLPSPIFYDTYIPIIFEYQLPSWNKSEVTFNNWYSCESDSLPYKSCAVMYHLNKAISNLHIDFESLQPVQDTASHTEHYETLYRESSFCDTIQPHFSGIFIQDPELEGYIDKMGRCRTAAGENKLLHIDLVPDFKYDITAPYNRIEMNFYEMFYKPINASSEILATAVLANSRSNIQATLLSTYYAEKFRWVHALQDCQRGLLPHSLISLAKLNATLNELAAKARFTANYEYAIDLALISKYYSLPLTDCTYTNDSFIVRLLFPINYKAKVPEDDANASMKSKPTQFFRLQPVPFRYENHLCYVNVNANVHAAASNIFLYDTRRKLAYPAGECRQNSLCQTSALNSHPAHSHPCASALLAAEGNEDVPPSRIRTACKLDCSPTIQGSQEEIMVTRVAPDKYILTGGPSPNNSAEGVDADASFVVVCGRNPIVHGLSSDQTQSGANELTLPCNCNFMFTGGSDRDNRRYFSDSPCSNTSTSINEKVTLVHIDPWYVVKNGSSPPEVDPDLISQYIQETYSRNSQEYTSTSGPPPPATAAASAASTNEEPQSQSQSLSVIWAPFLVVVILLLTLQMFVLYKLRLLSKSVCYHTQFDGPGTGTTNTLQSQANNTMDNLLYYKVTGRSQGQGNGDAEPEIHLLRNA